MKNVTIYIAMFVCLCIAAAVSAAPSGTGGKAGVGVQKPIGGTAVERVIVMPKARTTPRTPNPQEIACMSFYANLKDDIDHNALLIKEFSTVVGETGLKTTGVYNAAEGEAFKAQTGGESPAEGCKVAWSKEDKCPSVEGMKAEKERIKQLAVTHFNCASAADPLKCVDQAINNEALQIYCADPGAIGGGTFASMEVPVLFFVGWQYGDDWNVILRAVAGRAVRCINWGPGGAPAAIYLTGGSRQLTVNELDLCTK